MAEQNKTEAFIKDWEVDLPNKSARHKSGLGFSFQYENEDGSLRVEIENLMPWEQKMFAEYHDFELVDNDMKRLRGEFAQIYKEKMTVKENKLSGNILNSAMKDSFFRN